MLGGRLVGSGGQFQRPSRLQPYLSKRNCGHFSLTVTESEIVSELWSHGENGVQYDGL